jgi:hypothetical protein
MRRSRRRYAARLRPGLRRVPCRSVWTRSVSRARRTLVGMRFCVYATSTRRGPKPRGIIAGTQADDARPLWVADGVLHGAPQGAARTLCGLATDGLHLFADHNFDTVTISTGCCRDCVAAIDTYDDSARSD